MTEERLVLGSARGAISIATLPHSEDGAVRRLTERDAYWPAWRPATGRLSWSDASSHTAILVGGSLPVPGSQTDPPLLLGPRLPHYALWSPTGTRLCFVVPDGRSLVLKVWSVGESEATALVSGAPIFPVWHHTGDSLLVHHGSTLQRFDLATGEQVVLSNSAAGFRTPAVSSDGRRVAWAEVRDGAVRVMESLSGGSAPAQRASFQAGVALQYSGEPQQLAVAVGQSPDSTAFRELLLLDSGLAVTRSAFVAAWWSPDGSRVVALHPSYSGDGRYQPRLYNGRGAFLGAVESFVPAVDTATAVSFFDQYALSHSPWSATGRWFGLCGRFLTEGPHVSFSDGETDYAWAWDTESGELVRRLHPATVLAFER